MWSSHGQRFHLQENSIISFAIMSILEHISSHNAIHFSIFSWSLLQFLRSHSILLLKYDILFDLLTFFSDGYWGNLHVIRYVLCSTHVGSNNFKWCSFSYGKFIKCNTNCLCSSSFLNNYINWMTWVIRNTNLTIRH